MSAYWKSCPWTLQSMLSICGCSGSASKEIIIITINTSMLKVYHFIVYNVWFSILTLWMIYQITEFEIIYIGESLQPFFPTRYICLSFIFSSGGCKSDHHRACQTLLQSFRCFSKDLYWQGWVGGNDKLEAIESTYMDEFNSSLMFFINTWSEILMWVWVKIPCHCVMICKFNCYNKVI